MAPQTPKSSSKSGSSKSGSPKSPKSPKFSWSPRHRQALFVFHQKHMNDDQITFTFNQMFRNEIQSRGFSNGLNKTSIKAQFNRTYRTSCQAWQEVEASQDVELEWVSREMERLDITGSPPTSPISSPLRVQKPAQTRKPSQLVAVVIDSRPQTSSIATRNIFKQSPRSMVTHERTRTIGGEQVPIIRATDRNLVVKNPITPLKPIPQFRSSCFGSTMTRVEELGHETEKYLDAMRIYHVVPRRRHRARMIACLQPFSAT
jgi:hypothetical protein